MLIQWASWVNIAVIQESSIATLFKENKDVSGNLDLRLIFHKDFEDDIVRYSDSDYAGLIDGRKLTEAHVFMFASGTISHSSKL